MNKLTLIRTTDPESKLCSKLLEENKIQFIEVHSDSDNRPSLLIEGKTFSYKGLSQISGYVDYLNSVKKDYKK